MAAKYGTENSSIKLRKFIPKVSLMLLRRFLWRLWIKYIVNGLHPIGISYFGGISLVVVGIIMAITRLFSDISSLTVGMLLAVGVLLILCGMEMEVKHENN